MTLTTEHLTQLTTPKPGPMTSRLPTKFAKTNAALAAAVVKSPTRERTQP